MIYLSLWNEEYPSIRYKSFTFQVGIVSPFLEFVLEPHEMNTLRILYQTQEVEYL